MGNSPSAAPPKTTQLRPPDHFTTQWNMKTVYRLIELRRLAPFFPYVEDEDAGIDAEECPICLNGDAYIHGSDSQTYLLFVVGGLNRGKCCNKGVCTPCFLTIKKTPETPFGCPFCLVPNFEVHFTGPKTKEQIQIELEDQRKVDELRLQIRQEEIEADRQRELKRQQQREASAAKAIPPGLATPPNSPSSPMGSPILPANIVSMQQRAKTAQEIDEAELAAAIWLSLNPDGLASTSPSPPPTEPQPPV